MGYYTRYSLETDSANQEEIIADLREKYKGALFALTSSGDCSDESKWYDHETDMIAFSLGWPSTLFTLEGSGEEQPDFWKKHFKNGKIQRCKGVITYPDFDEGKLETLGKPKASLRF
jgi:hypothetical protein